LKQEENFELLNKGSRVLDETIRFVDE